MRLDKRLSPLSSPLSSGQQVEIITAPGARPNSAWLNFVVTGKARSKIKHYLKKQQRDESLELGKRLLDKALHHYGLNLEQVAENIMLDIAHIARLESVTHLFEEIGIGNRPALLAARQIAKALGENVKKEGLDAIDAEPITIKGTEGLVIRFASCCRPIPGDQIAGVIKVGHGVEVHLLHCPVITKIHHEPDKFVPLLWEEKINRDFSVDLKVELVNHPGSLASLALAISEAESNIENIRAQERDQHHFNVDLTISVRNRVHLARIMRKVRKRKDIIRVIRMRPKAEIRR